MPLKQVMRKPHGSSVDITAQLEVDAGLPTRSAAS